MPELRAAAEAAGLDWSKFSVTDNTCPPHPPPPPSLVAELEADVEAVEAPVLKSFARGFTVLEQEAARLEETLAEDLVGLEAEVGRDLRELEAEVVREFRSEEAALEGEAADAARLIRRFEMDAKLGWWAKVCVCVGVCGYGSCAGPAPAASSCVHDSGPCPRLNARPACAPRC